MITLDLAPPPAERHNYTNLHTAALEAYAEHGLIAAATGAIEVAAGYYSRAFAAATVEPSTSSTAALTPFVLSSIARRLITSGEAVHVLDVAAGSVRLSEASSWNVTGGARPETWRYQVSTTGPSTTETRWVPADQVVHCRYAVSHVEPWRGLAPLTLAGESGRLARLLERALADESGGPVGSVVPLPQDAGGEVPQDAGDGASSDDDPYSTLKRQIRTLRGACGLVETTAAGYGEGRAASPADDWKPRRVGANPPDALVELRAAVEETVLSACGIPPGLARAGAAGESRESFRRWYSASVLPLARLVEHELRDKLDLPTLRLDFASLAAADIHGRARAWRSLVGQEARMPDADARRLVGLDG